VRGRHDHDLRPAAAGLVPLTRWRPATSLVHLYDINWPSARSFFISFC
jgi:hypothetical protein